MVSCLAKAIKRRADFLASGAGAGENQTDQVDQPSLLHSPLRIFVYDASEREMDGNRGKQGQRKKGGSFYAPLLGLSVQKKNWVDYSVAQNANEGLFSTLRLFD